MAFTAVTTPAARRYTVPQLHVAITPTVPGAAVSGSNTTVAPHVEHSNRICVTATAFDSAGGQSLIGAARDRVEHRVVRTALSFEGRWCD
jgi:hypothetical protein